MLRPRTMRLFLAIAITVVAIAGPVSADEPSRSEYDKLVDEALSEFDGHRYEEALAAFEQAFAVRKSARALRGMAKALFELRSYARCVATIDLALASDVDPLAGALRADVEALRERALRFVGRVHIDVTPRGAAMLIDGRPGGSFVSRGVYVLDIGLHTLDLDAPDHHPARRTFEVHGNDTVHVAVELQSSHVVASGVSSHTTSMALAIGAVVLSTGAVLASSIWFVDRDQAASRCEDAASAGARCGNADAVAFQRDASMVTIGLSGLAAVLSGVFLVSTLRRNDDKPRATAFAW